MPTAYLLLSNRYAGIDRQHWFTLYSEPLLFGVLAASTDAYIVTATPTTTVTMLVLHGMQYSIR